MFEKIAIDIFGPIPAEKFNGSKENFLISIITYTPGDVYFKQ